MAQRQLRVLQISHDYEGPFCDICGLYASAFTAHDFTTVYLCGERDAGIEARTGGNRVIFLEQANRALRGLKLGPLRQVARILRSGAYDVVIAHRYKPMYLAGIMSRLVDIPVLLGVIHEHDVLKRLPRRLFVQHVATRMVCVGVSSSVSGNIARWMPRLAQQGRVATLPLALDATREQALLARDESRAGLGVPGEGFCFGTVGRLVTKKDHDVLLDAFGQLQHRHACFLAIVGAGPEEARLKSRARDLGIEGNVIFAGRVEQAWRYMKAFDVFVFPSSGAEAFGMALLEAMLAQLPLIVSDAPGPAEVVADTALPFPVGDVGALAARMGEALQMDASLREALGRKGRDRLLAHYTRASFHANLWRLPGLDAVAGRPAPL